MKIKKTRSGQTPTTAKSAKKPAGAKKASAAASPATLVKTKSVKPSRKRITEQSETPEPRLAPKSLAPVSSTSTKSAKTADKPGKLPLTEVATFPAPHPSSQGAGTSHPRVSPSDTPEVAPATAAPKEPVVSKEAVASSEPPSANPTPKTSLRKKAVAARNAPIATQPPQPRAPSKASELPPSAKPTESQSVPSIPAAELAEKVRPATRAKSKRVAALPRAARQPRRFVAKTTLPPAALEQVIPHSQEAKPEEAPKIEQPAGEPASPPSTPSTRFGFSIQIPPILLEGDEPSAPPISGPGQKYSVGPKPPAEPLGPEEGDLPEAYGTGRLLLTARDPHWLYVHWDLTGERQRRYNARSLHHHLVVRVYREALNGNPLSESHAHPESRHWFIHVPYGGTRYVAELGYYEREHQWIRVSTSDCVFTPPDMVTENKTVQFATIRFDLPPQRQAGPVIPQAEPQSPEHTAAGIPETLRSIALPPIERFGAIVDATHQAPMPLAEMFRRNLPPASPTEELTWTSAQERALAELLTITETRQEWLGSIAITELVERRRRLQAPGVPAPEIGWPEVVPSSPLGGELEFESITSPAGGEEAKGRSFWFNVNAELVVYGATEPDAEVMIGGRRIRLRRDGSFSYRFSLPDGDYELPIIATAAHGDSRRAILQFKRHTAYTGDVGEHPQDRRLKPPAAENLE